MTTWGRRRGHGGCVAMAFSEDDQPELEEIEDDPQDDATTKSHYDSTNRNAGFRRI